MLWVQKGRLGILREMERDMPAQTQATCGWSQQVQINTAVVYHMSQNEQQLGQGSGELEPSSKSGKD
jgi:hypothetical protein